MSLGFFVVVVVLLLLMVYLTSKLTAPWPKVGIISAIVVVVLILLWMLLPVGDIVIPRR